jgi:ferredoxin-nitrate reductase
MRSRNDADNFKKHVPKAWHVVIVGGGLLGLEMAASLREIGMRYYHCPAYIAVFKPATG